jgi:hypothetical protein
MSIIATMATSLDMEHQVTLLGTEHQVGSPCKSSRLVLLSTRWREPRP